MGDGRRAILGHRTRRWQWLRDGDPFDVAILDMHMPEMTGVELAAAIREICGGGYCARPELDGASPLPRR